MAQWEHSFKLSIYNNGMFARMKGALHMDPVKVSSRSVPKAVAGAIAAIIREGNSVEVQAVGAGDRKSVV